MKRLLAVSAAVAMLALCALLWQTRTVPGTDAGPVAMAGAALSPIGIFSWPAAAPSGRAFTTGLEDLPASLAGTDVDDAMRVDADGHLIVDYAVRALFDYFLTTVGEEPFATVAARLHAYVSNRLAEPARSEALNILGSYLAFWQAAGELSRTAQQAPDRSAPEAMAAYLVQMRDLRSRYFNREVDAAFFAEQDAYSAYTLARQQVLQDTSLDAVERAQKLGELLQQLPAGAQEAQRTATLIQTLDGMTDACRQSGCSPAEVQRIREELVGPEAAQRLAALDEEEAALQAKLAGYFIQRDRIASNPAYSESDRRMQIEALQQEMFGASELMRLAALERIHDGDTTPATP